MIHAIMKVAIIAEKNVFCNDATIISCMNPKESIELFKYFGGQQEENLQHSA